MPSFCRLELSLPTYVPTKTLKNISYCKLDASLKKHNRKHNWQRPNSVIFPSYSSC